MLIRIEMEFQNSFEDSINQCVVLANKFNNPVIYFDEIYNEDIVVFDYSTVWSVCKSYGIEIN